MGLVIERMTEQDLPQVLQIENDSFSSPFSEALFRGELKFDLAHPYVAHVGSEIIGYIDYWVVGTEAHVITIAVKANWRRQQVGGRLMQWMLDDVRSMQVKLVALDVRPSNVAALAFYTKFGFRQVGIRKNYYRDNNEDALMMALDLSGTS